MSETVTAFDTLTDEFFSVWLRYHPDLAVEAGVSGYEHLLPAQGDDELAALGSWLETLVVALEELDYTALDAGRQLDLRLMFGAARVEHQELLERDWRHRDPLRFLPVGEIYRLTLQPPENVRDALASLLEAVPEYLRNALAHQRSMAELVPPELVDAAVKETERGRCYLRELLQSAWLRPVCHGWSEIETLAEAAGKSLVAFGDGLRGEIAPRAAGRLGCGEGHLAFLFKQRHFLELDAECARGELLEALGFCEDALAGACAALRLERETAWTYLQERRVESGALLDTFRRESVRLEAFLRETGLVSLPCESLRISERPACPRPQRFGTDYIPDRSAGHGTFFLSATGEGDGRDQPLALLRARCLDRTWGGAHLLTFGAGDAGWRLPRRLGQRTSLADAWALYLRDRLMAQGFFEPEDRLLALLHRGSAIRRALLDLDLHTGSMTSSRARERLTAIPGAGLTELVFLARHPGSALAGVLGWRALERTRDAVRMREGADFREGRFNDQVLSYGRIPVSLVLDDVLGSA